MIYLTRSANEISSAFFLESASISTLVLAVVVVVVVDIVTRSIRKKKKKVTEKGCAYFDFPHPISHKHNDSFIHHSLFFFFSGK